ncbi:head-tail connector protein [Rhizobium herbae]|uniref:Phage protein (Predicted DNA packaging) n=1 Tax=Rhizobium herbae TaxID=508661 RepID=A0ABS4EFQ0_9HYPH|nr:head-tail connector protein [Rhizobium herbae]MBP1856771.1 putative phage protein (predicted DNA packaging) [Rhizobium herbae]
MATAVSLDQAKAHLRILHEFEDTSILEFVEAAEDHLKSVGVVFATPIQPAIRQAVLLLISHFYENRSAVDSVALREVPLAVSALTAPFREIIF